MARNYLRQCDSDAKLEARVMDLQGRRELVGGTAKRWVQTQAHRHRGCCEYRLGHRLKSGRRGERAESGWSKTWHPKSQIKGRKGLSVDGEVWM